MSISLDGVTHWYGSGPPVLDEVDLTVAAGESLAIVGPSGSGKSTLLAIIGLLLRPHEGAIHLDGKPVPSEERRRREFRRRHFAWVFQGVNALPGRTVLDNVAVGCLSSGLRRRDADEASRASLELVGLTGLEGRLLATLSGGERQRMCVARALAVRPRVVLADEPTGQLDRANSALVVDALLRLGEAGTSLVVATHDTAVASRCDRVLSLADGILVVG